MNITSKNTTYTFEFSPEEIKVIRWMGESEIRKYWNHLIDQRARQMDDMHKESLWAFLKDNPEEKQSMLAKAGVKHEA